jgi:hypothetical protein
MTTVAHSQRLAELFASYGLNAVVALELAEKTDAPITIWPYAVDFDPLFRGVPLARPSTDGTMDAPQVLRSHALILPSTLSAFDQARDIVNSNPVLRQGEAQIRIEIEALPLTELAAIFSASSINFRIALPVTIQ